MRLEVVKNEGGKRVMMKLARPRKVTKKDPSEWHNDSASFKELYDYCQADVAAERAIDKRLRDLPEKEKEIWALDQRINVGIVEHDVVSVEVLGDAPHFDVICLADDDRVIAIAQ